MRTVLAVVVVAAVAAGAFWAFFTSESTACFAAFKSHDAAERAADRARAVAFEVDVEEPGPQARRRTSMGARQISVSFTSGDTGDDAAAFRKVVRQIAEQEGAVGKPRLGCTELSFGD